jgi:plasmid stabilization system protein ParE
MSRYIFAALATQGLKEIRDVIAVNNVKAASTLFDAIRQKCKLVANFPNMGKNYSWLTSNLRGFVVSIGQRLAVAGLTYRFRKYADQHGERFIGHAIHNCLIKVSFELLQNHLSTF